MFGVRGSVVYDEAFSALECFKLTQAKKDRILACGVRKAIKGANDLCTARYAALREMPKRARGANRRRVKVVIPPKPRQAQSWLADQGGGG